MTNIYLVRNFLVAVTIASLTSMSAFAGASKSSNAKAHAAPLTFEEAAEFVRPHVHTWKSTGRAIIAPSNDKPSDFFQIMVQWEKLPEAKLLSVNKVSGDVWLFMMPSNCARLAPSAALKKRQVWLRGVIGDAEYMKQHSKKPSDCFEIVPSPGFYL